MKLKPWLKYLVYTILILLFVFLKGLLNKKISDIMKITFEVNYPLLILCTVLGICIGIVLGFDYFLKEIKKDGSLKINLPKLLIAGIPSLYFALYYVLIYSRVPFLQYIAVYPLFTVNLYSIVDISLFQSILGYVIITSFYKTESLSYCSLPH